MHIQRRMAPRLERRRKLGHHWWWVSLFSGTMAMKLIRGRITAGGSIEINRKINMKLIQKFGSTSFRNGNSISFGTVFFGSGGWNSNYGVSFITISRSFRWRSNNWHGNITESWMETTWRCYCDTGPPKKQDIGTAASSSLSHGKIKQNFQAAGGPPGIGAKALSVIEFGADAADENNIATLGNRIKCSLVRWWRIVGYLGRCLLEWRKHYRLIKWPSLQSKLEPKSSVEFFDMKRHILMQFICFNEIGMSGSWGQNDCGSCSWDIGPFGSFFSFSWDANIINTEIPMFWTL